jgi:basic amino acid/polyamine antiporter, APA family
MDIMNFKSRIIQKKSIPMILADSHCDSEGIQLKKSLTVRDLTGLGIAAIVGAGIFSTIGNAAYHGGPAVSFLFLFTAVACGLSALCYAQFASTIPVSGSAYTYAYASMGEIAAWIIGWGLIMEYAVGNIAVAISWSDYFTVMLTGLGIHFPEYLSMDYLTAKAGYDAAEELLRNGTQFFALKQNLKESWLAWQSAPALTNQLRLIVDIPAIAIIILITRLVYIGMQETKKTANLMVIIKLAVLIAFIGIGAFYIHPEHWHPFAPNGISGVLKGVSGVFFAYIGFDAISTTAEECYEPQKDLPRAMLYSLFITTAFYILISMTLTGMVHYTELSVGDPLAFVFQKLNLPWLSGIISLCAVIAMTGVLIVYQVGQPRIWMSMSRDGLLPHVFSKLHPRYHTPSFSTIMTGIIVSVPLLFVNLEQVTDLTSAGTLFAFAMVSSGVLALDNKNARADSGCGYRIPYLNSRYWILPLWIALFSVLYNYNADNLAMVLRFDEVLSSLPSAWTFIDLHLPKIIFAILSFVVTTLCLAKELSLLPVISLLSNAYLMAELGVNNWKRFILWMIVGLVIYFIYGIRKSRLNSRAGHE